MSKGKKAISRKVFLEDDAIGSDDVANAEAENDEVDEKLHNPSVTFVNDSSDGEQQQASQKMYFTTSEQLYVDAIFAQLRSIDTQYEIPYLLREIGNRVLHDPNIRLEYMAVKDPLTHILELKETQIKDEKKQSKTFKNLERDVKKIKALINDRDDYYKKYQDGTLGEKESYAINKKIIKYSEANRANFELFNDDIIGSNASTFFAKLKAQKKYDRDLGKQELYNFKHGTSKFNNDKAIACKTTQQDETLEISPNGCFSHKITDEGSYTTLGATLNRYFDGGFLNKLQFKNFLIGAFRNQISDVVILDHDKKDELSNELKTVVKLLLLEMQREAASIITIPMFFDLVDRGVYQVNDIANKFPMAMKEAVSSSMYLYDAIKKHLTSYSKYDYRDKGVKNKDELSTRENSIFNDWFKQELELTLDLNNAAHQELFSLCIYKLMKEWYGLSLDVLVPYISNFVGANEFDDVKSLDVDELQTLIAIWQDPNLHDCLLNIVQCISLAKALSIYINDQDTFELLSHKNVAKLINEYNVDFDDIKELSHAKEKFEYLIIENFDLIEDTYTFDEILEKYDDYVKDCADIAEAIRNEYIKENGCDTSTQGSEHESNISSSVEHDCNSSDNSYGYSSDTLGDVE